MNVPEIIVRYFCPACGREVRAQTYDIDETTAECQPNKRRPTHKEMVRAFTFRRAPVVPVAQYDRVATVAREYSEHQDWRCHHRDRWPWEPDCPCGLTKDMREAGL